MKKTRYLSLLLLLFLLAGLLSGCVGQIPAAPTPTETLQLIVDPSPSPAAAAPAPETAAPSPAQTAPEAPAESPAAAPLPDEDGVYTTAEDVAAYLIAYGHLPGNFITKKQARDAGWNGGALEPYCPGKCIGGDRFGNREGLLPSARGRSWTECDINTLGASSRGAERLVFSNDGLIYYTGDHYESFQLLYEP